MQCLEGLCDQNTLRSNTHFVRNYVERGFYMHKLVGLCHSQ